MDTPRLSVIVPVLNESASLPRLLPQLAVLQAGGAQVIVVDGGSSDDTVTVLTQAGLAVLHAPRGRATQLRAGAQAATADRLLFLHADTRLPPGAVATLAAAWPQGHVWGRFDVLIEGRSRMLPVVAALMNWRSRLTGIATGDQALFMTRAAYDAVGGFPDQPLMEDVEITARLRHLSRPWCIADRVVTSGRRWDSRGAWATIVLMWRLRWAYWRGASPAELAKAYR